MQNDQGIMLILICTILIICYFAPLTTIDTFGNVKVGGVRKFNPQGSYVSPDTFNPGSDVEEWRINKNLYEPGTRQSLNFPSLKTAFPYNKFLPERYNEDDIGLIKSDGVIVGGYMPQIIRPFDSVTANPKPGSKCQWPCYSDRKFQQWCSEENAINYHAMRPLVSPGQYNNNLRRMFLAIIDKKGPFRGNGPQDDQYSKVDGAVFCTESQQAIMSWLMQKIALQVTKMPEMQRNGPWKTERFYDTDVQMYQYVNPDSSTYFKVIFNLFNPLRSVSTMVYATVYIVNGDPSLVDMDFINNQSMDDFMAPQNGFGPITGHNVGTSFESTGGGMDIIQPEPLGFTNTPEGQQMWEDFYKKDPNDFDWNYMNTLEVQKFNKEGFYSNVPGDNIKIEGGVPESLKKALRTSGCKEANLMSCMTPGYTGITGPSAKSMNESKGSLDKDLERLNIERSNTNYKVAPLDGSVKNVYADPSLIYNNSNSLSLRGVETASGTIYV
jgi:hypothetical protein